MATILAMTTPILELAEVRRLAEDGSARSIRIDARLSLTEMANAVGVEAGTVARWEAGDRRPRGDAAIRYLEVLRALRQAAAA